MLRVCGWSENKPLNLMLSWQQIWMEVRGNCGKGGLTVLKEVKSIDLWNGATIPHSTQWKAQYGHLRSLILGYWNHETTSFSELEYMETAKLNNLDPQYDFHFKLSNYFGSYRDTFGPYSSCHKCKESMAYQMMLGSPKDLQTHKLPPKTLSRNFWKRR